MHKSLACLLFPLIICIEFVFIGLIFLWFSNKQRIGKILITIGLLLLILFSNKDFANFLLGFLEHQYPAIVTSKDFLRKNNDIKYIVVLGGSLNYEKKLPVTSQLNSHMIIRLMEGIRLYKEIPDVKLVLSGGGQHEETEAEAMSKVAIMLGIKKEDIILEARSGNTYEEAIFTKRILGNSKFILVTSARHMPRSMGLFKKLDMDPIPAPANHLVKSDAEFIFDDLIPHVSHLMLSSEAFYEFLGLFKEKLLGRI